MAYNGYKYDSIVYGIRPHHLLPGVFTVYNRITLVVRANIHGCAGDSLTKIRNEFLK